MKLEKEVEQEKHFSEAMVPLDDTKKEKDLFDVLSVSSTVISGDAEEVELKKVASEKILQVKGR